MPDNEELTGMTMPETREKKDKPENAKGDKGHEGEEMAKERTENPNQQAGSGREGGHRRRTGGNPDGSS